MIWFFIAGFISGWVGMMLFAGWWIRKHAVPVVEVETKKEITPEEMFQMLKDMDFKTYTETMRCMVEIEKEKGEKSDD